MADVIIVVDTGIELVVDRIMGLGLEPKYVAWGTGSAAPSGVNIALQNESPNEARVEGVITKITSNTLGDTFRTIATMTCESVAKIITEVGLLTAATDGTLFVRGAFSPIGVEVNDSITFTIKGVFARPVV